MRLARQLRGRRRYNENGRKLLEGYLSPDNPDGFEPQPDAIAVNGKFSGALKYTVLPNSQARRGALPLPCVRPPAAPAAWAPYLMRHRCRSRSPRPLVSRPGRWAQVRVRFINAAAFSQWNVSVDGMPLTLIELDGQARRDHNPPPVP